MYGPLCRLFAEPWGVFCLSGSKGEMCGSSGLTCGTFVGGGRFPIVSNLLTGTSNVNGEDGTKIDRRWREWAF